MPEHADPSVNRYLETNRIRGLLAEMYLAVCRERPADVLEFLGRRLATHSPQAEKIMANPMEYFTPDKPIDAPAGAAGAAEAPAENMPAPAARASSAGTSAEHAGAARLHTVELPVDTPPADVPADAPAAEPATSEHASSSQKDLREEPDPEPAPLSREASREHSPGPNSKSGAALQEPLPVAPPPTVQLPPPEDVSPVEEPSHHSDSNGPAAARSPDPRAASVSPVD